MGNKTDPIQYSQFGLLFVRIVMTYGLKSWPHRRVDIQHLYCFLHALKRNIGTKTDPRIFNMRIVVYMHWKGIWVTRLTSWADQDSTLVLFFNALERHMGSKTDTTGGPPFNNCIAFYAHCNDIWVTKLAPWEGRYSTSVQRFFAHWKHMGNETDPMEGSIFNICIGFCTHWNDIWITKLTPWEGRQCYICLVFARIGTRYG